MYTQSYLVRLRMSRCWSEDLFSYLQRFDWNSEDCNESADSANAQ